jgi:tetratricopeptide (TPR) repeat protein
MTVLVLLLLSGVPADPPHIKAALAAYQQGKTDLLKKQPKLAVEQFNKAIAIEPTFLDAYKELIAAHLAAGHRLEAASVITRLLEIDPRDDRERLSLAQILLGEKQWDRSLAQFSLVLQDEPFNADALLGFAAAAKSVGLDGRASEALSKGRTHYPLDKRFRDQ